MEIRELSPDSFPAGLREIPKPPKRLWTAGSLPPSGTKLLAVVGSRALTRYGKEACESLLERLAGYPISVVSGLAFGADACAHRAAMRAGLHTLAVPGSGLDEAVLYPRAHVSLAQEILTSGGALLSEHPPDHVARLYDFPSRNRLMVGMADAVLMVEAGPRSGTLITARLAGDYGRELLCVPHRIGDPHGYGAHLFLRIGAALAAEPAHILEALGIPERGEDVEPAFPLERLSPDERALYALSESPLTRDELLRAARIPAHDALAALAMLELKGLLKEEFGTWQRT